MFTGNPPWSSKGIDTAMALMFYISNADGPPTEEYPDNASLALIEFLNRCFDFNEESRPTTDELLKFDFMLDQKTASCDVNDGDSLTRHGSEALAKHIANSKEQMRKPLSNQATNYSGDEVTYAAFDYSSDEEDEIEDVANFIQKQVSDANAMSMSIRVKSPSSPNPFGRGNIFSMIPKEMILPSVLRGCSIISCRICLCGHCKICIIDSGGGDCTIMFPVCR